MKKSLLSSLGIVLAALILLGVFAPTKSNAFTYKKEKKNYLVMLPHTKEECLKTLDEYSADASKLLPQIEWGCMAGDHTGYLFMMGKDEDEVRNMLPANQRSGAKIEMVNKFTKEQIKSFHNKH